MRVLVDAQCVQSTSSLRGIGRYALSFIRALVATADAHHVEVLLNAGDDPARLMRARLALEQFLPPGHIHVFDAAWPWTPPYNDRRRPAAEAAYTAAVRSLRPDVLLVASPFEGDGETVLSIGAGPHDPPTAAILYDLIPALEPEVYLMGPGADVYWRRFEDLQRCAALLAISQHSGRQAGRLLGDRCPRVTAVWGGAYPSGAFPAFEPQTDDHPEVVLPERFVLSVGGDHPRKNLDRLVKAWGRVPSVLRRQTPLVLACRLNPGTVRRLKRLARRAGVGPTELVLTGGVSEMTLHRLYTQAYAFVFPSIEEGLGMPPLEAMAAGCPTVLARGSSLDELCDEPVAFFDGLRIDEIAAALERVMTDEAVRATLRRAAERASRRFTWEHSAQLAWETLASIATLASPPPGLVETPIKLSNPKTPAALNMRPQPVLIDVDLPPSTVDETGLSVQARTDLAAATVLVVGGPAVASGLVQYGLLDAPVLIGSANLPRAVDHDFYREYARGLGLNAPPVALVPHLVGAVQTAPRWMLERPRPVWLLLSRHEVEPTLKQALDQRGVDLLVTPPAGVSHAGLVDAVIVTAVDFPEADLPLAAARRRGARVILAGPAASEDIPDWCELLVLVGEVTSQAAWESQLDDVTSRWGRTTGWPWRERN